MKYHLSEYKMKNQTILTAVFILFTLLAIQLNAQTDSIEYKYPKLGVKVFSGRIGSNDNAALKQLSCFGLVACPLIMSTTQVSGGVSLGIHRGYGSYHDTIYNFNAHDYSGIPQLSNYTVKQGRPDMKFFGYLMGPKKIELNNYYKHGKNFPKRYLVDNISPKWIAYTVLDTITQNLSNNPFDTVLHFTSEAAHRIYYGMKTHDIPDTAVWMEPYVYKWSYICFKDNDSNATRGNFEIMAVKKVDLNTGDVTVALKRKNGNIVGRTIFGVPLSYTHGDRAGLIASCDSTQGTPGIIMNCYYNPNDPKYKTEMLADTNDWNSDWLGALTEYARMILMKAKINNTYLCDGVMMDTDDEYWKAYTYQLANPSDTVKGYLLDMNWDGQVDSVDTINTWLPEMYHNLLYRIDTTAKSLNRDFFVMRNGHITQFGNTVGYVAGREFEDFGMVSQDSTYEDALNQYIMLADTMNTTQPHVTMLSERDRDSAENNQHNYKEHRHKMAIATVLGEGYYTHTGNHSSHITAWGNDTSLTDGPEDWFDEFAVDSNGVSAKKLASLYATNALDSVNFRIKNIGWLGFALNKGYKIDSASYNFGWAYTFRRDFENGIVIYSQYPHTVQLDTLYKIIDGADPGNTGDTISSINFNTSKTGIFLVRLSSTPTNINIIKTRGEILIYPNPANNMLKIHLLYKKNQSCTIEINDVTGKKLLKQEYKNNYININTIDFSNGFYFVTIKTDNAITTKKIIINH